MRNRFVLVLVTLLASLACRGELAPLPSPNLQLGGDTREVFAVARLPDGGVLVGGNFQEVNGIPRHGLARLHADGSFDSTWDAALPSGATVHAIAIAGNGAYIGGIFDDVGGVSRDNLARIVLPGTAADPTWAPGVDRFVYTLAVAGTDLVVGGNFDTVAGSPRASLAKVALADGMLSPWTNDVLLWESSGTVTALEVAGDQLFVGGTFDHVGGAASAGIASVSLSASSSPAASFVADTVWVHALRLKDGWLYAGGQDGLDRVDPITGAVDAGWDASVIGSVNALATTSNALLLGGQLHEVGGVPRTGLAQVSLATGAVTPWNPIEPGLASVHALSIDDTAILVGMGDNDAALGFDIRRITIGGSAEPTFGAYVSDYGDPGTEVIEFAADGRTYIGGGFRGVNGLPIAFLARLGTDGSLDPDWRPAPSATVHALATTATHLIVGGSFTRMGNAPRNRLAKVALDAFGTVDATWNPDANGPVRTLAVESGSVFAAGDFSMISALARQGIARLPLGGAGSADPAWNAGWQSGTTVKALVAHDGSVVVGGLFGTEQTGQPYLLRLSGTTGARDTAWTPLPDGPVEALALDGASLFVAGRFDRIGNLQQPKLAKLDFATGAVDAQWMPIAYEDVEAIAVRNGVLYSTASEVSGIDLVGSQSAMSTATGLRDRTWSTPFLFTSAFSPRAGQVWLGSGGASSLGDGVVAFPEAFCAARVDGTSCEAGAGIVATCQANVCTPAMIGTVTTLSVQPQPPVELGQTTVTAAVASANGPPPEGEVFFYGASGLFEAMSLDNGVATFTAPALADYARIVAIFVGSPTHTPSRSNEIAGPLAPSAARHDFTSDGRPDILFRNTASGDTFLWRMNGVVLESDAAVASIDPSWRVAGHGDFDGDGRNDLVWRDSTSGAAFVWYMDGATLLGDAPLFTIDPAWAIEAVADFNSDGRPDFLFRHATSGVGFVWYFDNTTPLGDQFLYSIDNAWIVEGVGDFNADRYPDFLFRNTTSGLAFVWYWNGTGLGTSEFFFSIDPQWQVVQLADWDGDAGPDLVFRNASSGVTFVWYTNGVSLQDSDFLFQVDSSWAIVPGQ